MAEEVKKGKRGGYRPGAGRKPKPVDTTKRNLSSDELKIRQTLESLFRNGQAVKAPDYLDDVAYAKWNEIMLAYSQLPINVLNILDTSQLALYCINWSRFKKAYDVWKVTMQGAIVTNSDMQNKQIKQVQKTMDDVTTIMCRIAPDLLLTPTGRVKYGANGAASAKQDIEDEEDALDRFIALKIKR